MKLSLLNMLIGILLITVVFLIVISFLSVPVLQAVLSVPFLLFFPGFTLITAISPKNTDIKTSTRVILSFILSILVDSVIGLTLNYTSFGITLSSISYTVSFFIFIFTIVGILRQIITSKNQRTGLDFSIQARTSSSGVLNASFLGIMIFAVLGSMASVTYFAFSPKIDETFTQFFIVKQGNGALYIRDTGSVEGKVSVTLKIINREGSQVNYRVQAFVNGKISSNINPVTISNGQEWENIIVLSVLSSEQSQLEFRLYKNNEPAPYLGPLRVWVGP